MGTGLVAEIFRMRQAPIDNTVTPPLTTNYFDGVCTPFDLQNLPANAPIAPGDQFRVSTVTITYRSPDYGEKAWQDIQENIQMLINSLVANTDLSQTVTVTFSGA